MASAAAELLRSPFEVQTSGATQAHITVPVHFRSSIRLRHMPAGNAQEGQAYKIAGHTASRRVRCSRRGGCAGPTRDQANRRSMRSASLSLKSERPQPAASRTFTRGVAAIRQRNQSAVLWTALWLRSSPHGVAHDVAGAWKTVEAMGMRGTFVSEDQNVTLVRSQVIRTEPSSVGPSWTPRKCAASSEWRCCSSGR